MLEALLKRPSPLPEGAYRALLALPAALALACPVVASALPEATVWGVALASLLRSCPPFFMLFTPLVAYALGRRQRRWRLPLAAAVAGLALAGLPPPLRPPPPDGGWALVASNVNAYSPDDDATPMQAALGALSADVLIAIERRATEVPGMRRVADNYQADIPMASHGTAVFCKTGLACEARITDEFGSPTWKMPIALARLPDGLCVMGAHAPPPAPYDASGIGYYMQEIASHLRGGRLQGGWAPCRDGDAALLMGDLNAVPGSDAYAMLIAAGLRDELRHAGVWGASWPAGGGWPWAPFFRLDHVLSGDVAVGGVRHVSIPGADHRAVRLVARAAAQPGP